MEKLCKNENDSKVPTVTDLDCALQQVSQHNIAEGTIKSRSLPSKEAAMTVGFLPTKSPAFRFQSIIMHAQNTGNAGQKTSEQTREE